MKCEGCVLQSLRFIHITQTEVNKSIQGPLFSKGEHIGMSYSFVALGLKLQASLTISELYLASE